MVICAMNMDCQNIAFMVLFGLFENAKTMPLRCDTLLSTSFLDVY